ncbi:MAG TPA: DUF1553 domain-containing protein [Isosphaeraceae bacterium]|nr:DUF1553 domain-containing protein [Isosphaeraceae bacterium]
MGFASAAASVLGGEKERPVDFNREIRPILSKNCFPCHGQDEAHRAKGLRLDKRDVAIKPLEDEAIAIVPGDPEASEVVARITEEDSTQGMPPRRTGNRLTPEEVALITRWIGQGATYAEHWAFIAPKAEPLPDVNDRSWPRNGIDFWILARLEKEGLKPSPEADTFTLLRRVSLDLRGLPPQPEELDEFLRDTSPGAYERAVDRFLSDPAYGERWARVWLDLARYADSAGYGSDPLRTIWRYRDWVIDAFNRNLPYNQFTIEQLAGDLLPRPTLEQRMATAFHRNTMTNTEGGTDDEEFRTAAIKDRVDTTSQVWMGLTIGCAKCHSHKYDPITQEEYYKLYSFFNQTADTDQPDERPTIPAPTPAFEAENARVEAQLAALKKQMEEPTRELTAARDAWEARLRPHGDWVNLVPVEARSEAGAEIQVQPDHSLSVAGKNADQDTYVITLEADLAGITAFRLEAIPDASLPGGGAGRAADGNFVLSRLSVEAEPASEKRPAPVGKYLRVELPGTGKILSLAEVEAFSQGENVARQGEAQQSSTDYEGAAARAIDGKTDGNYFDAKSTTHTQAEANPWWELKLAEPRPIDRITIWNRTDGDTGARLAGFKVQVLDEERAVVWQTDVAEPPKPSVDLSPGGRLAVGLAHASADFTQQGFNAADITAAAANPKKGWAVAPKLSEPHKLQVLLKQPLAVSTPARLTFRLEHRYKDAGYNLGHFRLSATNDSAAGRRIEVPEPILEIVDTPAENRTAEQTEALARHYRSIAPALKPIRDEIAKVEKTRPQVPTVPVMTELPADQRRTTHLLIKSNFLAPGAKVEPGVPQALHPFPQAAPPNRLGLAEWIVDANNPLTARVAVNRLWAQVFGTGIVETEEDFGTQGELPSHPELLDWLAMEYMHSGWDTKALLRLIVTSATYRQASKVTPELLARDPRNRLLARAPRLRLEAEMVRDQALALCGLLSRKLGGPSVFPPQPDGLWQAAFNGQRTWSTSKGDDRYRRGLYTFWRRTVPYPSMATFDAPSREICSIKRSRTNTPLQAFVTLNDPAYVEAAQALARRILHEGGSTTDDRLKFAIELCLCRPPQSGQLEPLRALLESQRTRFASDPEAAKALAGEPLGPLPCGVDPAELAAWTTIANVLLNLDAVLTKS